MNISKNAVKQEGDDSLQIRRLKSNQQSPTY